MVPDDIKNVLAGFAIEGDLVDCTPYGNGHIHDTYAATYRDGDGSRRFIHQRLNHHVFKDPVGMMRNIVRVCEHLGNKLDSGPQQVLEIADNPGLTLIKIEQLQKILPKCSIYHDLDK